MIRTPRYWIGYGCGLLAGVFTLLVAKIRSKPTDTYTAQYVEQPSTNEDE